jgi:hypothetical protein
MSDDIYHPGELVHGLEHGDDISVELDEGEPGMLLITINEEGTHTGSVYVDPEDAIEFANALTMYAEFVLRNESGRD